MKYNLSNIMKSAWAIRRNAGRLTFSECLKRAWAHAKFLMKNAATVIAEKFVDGMTVVVDGYERTLVRWTKGRHDRVYINGGSRNGDGYVDLVAKKACLRSSLTYQEKIANMILNMFEDGDSKF